MHMARARRGIPGVDATLLAHDAAKLLPDLARRRFLRGGASLGALALLAGCDIVDGPSAENALRIVSRFNDRVQALLFDPNRLAPTYPESAITRPFPFNAYYKEEDAPEPSSGSMHCRRRRRSRGSSASRAGAQSASGPAPRCAISCAGSAPTPARSTCISPARKAIRFRSTWLTALHPQTQLTFRYDGEILPAKYGFPMRVRMPTKLGFKNPKHVVGIAVLNH
jgi:hypothetical protein